MEAFRRVGTVINFQNFLNIVFTASRLALYYILVFIEDLKYNYQFFYFTHENFLTCFLEGSSTHILRVFDFHIFPFFKTSLSYRPSLIAYWPSNMIVTLHLSICMCSHLTINQNYFHTSQINPYDISQIFLTCLFLSHSHPAWSLPDFNGAMRVPLH